MNYLYSFVTHNAKNCLNVLQKLIQRNFSLNCVRKKKKKENKTKYLWEDSKTS